MANYRRRMLWPSFFEDPHVQQLPVEARLLFLAHILRADDQGRGDLGPVDWKAICFPQDRVSEDDIRDRLLPLLWRVKSGKRRPLVEPYEIDGLVYWHLPRWRTYQSVDRPSTSKIPAPEEVSRKPVPEPDQSVRSGKKPSFNQWELLRSMAEERGTTLAKAAQLVGVQSVDDILARDVTAIKAALSELPQDQSNGREAVVRQAARGIRTLIQVGDLSEIAAALDQVPGEIWTEVRAEVLAMSSNYGGQTKAEVFESIRRFYE